MSVMGIEIIGDGQITDRFDLFICTLGYETRSSHLARTGNIEASHKVAIAFPDEDYAAYRSNSSYLTKAGYTITPNGDGGLHNLILEVLRKSTDQSNSLSMLIDISSMSRPMLADIVFLLSTMIDAEELLVTFAYLPAQFVKENAEHAPVAVTEPVTPNYAGWTTTPERPISAVVGLGYEHDLALGTIEYLEPNAAWIFIPTGEDRRFDDAVKQANRDLRQVLSDDRAMTYNVDVPTRAYAIVESLVYGLLRTSRPVLIPFGPKIFCLICLLVARVYSPEITVWRVSGEALARPGDRKASGKLITLRVRFAKTQQS